MARAFDHLSASGSTSTSLAPLQVLILQRLIIGSGIALGSSISLIGTSWDIQWHSFVGRDRTLIPPHIMMLTGVALVGILALTSVVRETRLAKRNLQMRAYTSSFADFFSSSLGAYIAGFAALNAAIAFPLDSYWHALYGIDVRIWAPFHVMILTGMAVMSLGGAYMLTSGIQLARANTQQARGLIRLAQVANIIALSAMFGTFTLMLSDALDSDNFIQLTPHISLTLFPLLAGILTAFTFTLVKYAFPYKLGATYVILGYIVFALLFSVLIPPATNMLVLSEGLHYRGSIGHFTFLSAVAVRMWPLMPIIVAPLLDYCTSLARRKNWQLKRLTIVFTLLFLLSGIPVAVLLPDLVFLLVGAIGSVGLLLSLAIAIPAILVGIRLGRISGTAMSRIEL